MVKVAGIYPHEMQALLEALRRDLRSERIKAAGKTKDADFHRQNERHIVRLLECLNPRMSYRGSDHSSIPISG